MEPTKLETDFQNKLNQREINPSTNSWDRLDAMLTVAEEKKSKRSYDWLYLAASIIGFLCIGALFFSQTEELVDTRRNDVVLDTNEIVKPSENKIHEETNKEITSSVQSQSVAAVSEVKMIKSNPEKSELIIKNQVAQNPTPNTQNLTPNSINQKSEQLHPFKQDNVKVGERITAVEIPSKNETSKSSIKVDAQNLLSQVDGELELSFREKVINTIDKNYKTVKVALANRNYQ